MAEIEFVKIFNAMMEVTHSSLPSFEDFFVIIPPANVYETSREYVVQIALPGVRKEDIKIGFSRGRLTVLAERREEFVNSTNPDAPRYRLLEISPGRIKRTIFIGEDVDLENIKTTYKDGILEIRLPRKVKNSSR